MQAPPPFATLNLVASDNSAQFDNRVAFSFPVVLRPTDFDGTVAAAGVVGGLLISAFPDWPGPALPIPAGINGQLVLYPGKWVIRVERWGALATGQVRIPFAVWPYTDPLSSGLFSSLPLSRISRNNQPATSGVSTTIVSLADMLEGIVAIGVTPLAVTTRFRFGNSPAGTQFDISLPAGTRYVFKGEELPLAELNAATTGAADNCRVIRYIR